MKKRILSLLMAMALMLMTTAASLPMTVSAEITSGTLVVITKKGQVVDSITFNGKKIDAVYAPRDQLADPWGDPTYSCAAFVSRFYMTVYGVGLDNMYATKGTAPGIYTGGGSFTETKTPVVGDIYANASEDHWAIVKSVSNSTVTLIEQNYSRIESDGRTTANYGRQVVLPESSCRFYHYSGNANTYKGPTNVSLSASKSSYSGSENVSLTIKAANATSYDVYIKNSWGQVVNKTSTTSKTVSLKSKACGTVYAYVTAKNSYGALNSATISFNVSHSYGSWVTEEAATCTDYGYKTRTCTNCGDTQYQDISPLGHNYMSHVVEPTTTSEGFTVHVCTRCNDMFKDNYTPMLEPETTTVSMILMNGVDPEDAEIELTDSDGNWEYGYCYDGSKLEAQVLSGKTYSVTVYKDGYVTRTYDNIKITGSSMLLYGDIRRPGDMDGSGTIDASDVTDITAAIKGITILDDYDRDVADVDYSGSVDTSDLTAVTAHCKGLLYLWMD